MFQLRNLVNRRNIKKDPSDDVNASEDFFTTVVHGHILAAAMEVFKMDSLDEVPCDEAFTQDPSKLDVEQKRDLMQTAVHKIVDKFVNMSIVYDKDEKGKEVDGVYEYACETLTLGLLLLEFNDSIQWSDGDRIFRCWRYFMVLFKSTSHKNYAIEAFVLLAQEKFLQSPRIALQLKWSRTINTHGKPGKNIPCDLHMEHLNREAKNAFIGLGSNITDQSVKRIGQCLGVTVSILDNFDRVNNVPRQSGHHSKRSAKADLEKIVQQLSETSQVFKEQIGRSHFNFRSFRNNLIRRVPLSDLKQWMSQQYQKLIVYK